ncbi:FIMAH domain-containing protein [Actinoplanes sp. G11-F43]|uniref:FIMAH domain-containing protein n=1 Tax=Actinoplanes sp. G11-F43 TaxID=3424130 RepID=UPI003D348480
MHEPHDPHQPTTVLPVVPQRSVYRAANHRRTALIAGGVAGVVLLGLVVWMFSGDDAADPVPASAPAPIASAPGPAPAATEPEPEAGESAEPAESTAPTTAPVTQRPATAAELISGLITAVDALEDQDQIEDDADKLIRRLKDAAKRLDRGDTRGAARKIDDFTRKLDDLRDDEDLTDEAFDLLATGADRIRERL